VRHWKRMVVVVFTLSALILTAGLRAQETSGSPDLPRRFVVVLADGAGDVESLSAEMARSYGGKLEPFSRAAERSFALVIAPARAHILAADPRVRSVEEIGPDGVRKAPVKQPIPPAPQTARALTPRSDLVSDWTTGPYRYDSAGDIISIGPNSDGNTDRYSYDGVGRLVTATAHTATRQNSQSYVYDAFGNLKEIDTAGSGPTVIYVDSTNNRISAPTPPDLPQGATVVFGEYDAAGNQTSLNGVYHYAWDGLGTMRQLSSGARLETYLYDGDDERIGIIRGPVTGAATYRYTIRDHGGHVIRVFKDDFNGSQHNYSWERDYVYRDSLLLGAVVRAVDGSQSRRHFHVDHLGTPRLITDDATRRLAVHTYWPYGQEAPGSDSDDELMKFTGHERDFGDAGDTNVLDYMHARFDNPNIGRFLSLDRATASRQNPQSWNRYIYASDNPIKYLDPSGQVELTFTLLTRIPGARTPMPWYHPKAALSCWGCTLQADGFGERGITFTHDTNRYRTKQEVTIETDPRKSTNPIVGPPFNGAGQSASFSASGKLKETDRATEVGEIKGRRDKDGNAIIDIHLHSSLPLLPMSPAIDADIQITASKDGRIIKVTGIKDGFPAYHLFVTNDKGQATDIFRYNPYDKGNTANALWPFGAKDKIGPIICDPYGPVGENCKTTK